MRRLTVRRVYLVGSAASALALLVLAARFAPAVALSLSLALPATETSLAPFFPNSVREEIVLSAGSRRIPADLYRPVQPRAALLLVHGLSRAGRRHAELVRLARLLAREGELVLVPEFEGLVAFKLDGSEIDEIRGALSYLTGLSQAVGIVGFSFGAGPALLAAAAYPDIALVGSFGGYADLQNVITYVTTGVHTFGGRRYVQQQEEYNRWKLLAMLVGFVESERDRKLLDTIAGRKLENPAIDTTGLGAKLGPEGRAVLSLVLNRQHGAVATLLADLSPRTRQALASLSPRAAVPRLRGRLLIAHGVADESIPFTESLRLADAAGGRAELAIRAHGDEPRQLPSAPRAGTPRPPHFMNDKCGLVNRANPCRCAKKTRGFITGPVPESTPGRCIRGSDIRHRECDEPDRDEPQSHRRLLG